MSKGWELCHTDYIGGRVLSASALLFIALKVGNLSFRQNKKRDYSGTKYTKRKGIAGSVSATPCCYWWALSGSNRRPTD